MFKGRKPQACLTKGPYPLGLHTADSRRAIESVVKYQTCLIRRVSRLYGESADHYGQSSDAYIATGV